MFEKLLNGFYTGLVILVCVYLGVTFMQVEDLAERVDKLEKDKSSWDITIVRPVLPRNNND